MLVIKSRKFQGIRTSINGVKQKLKKVKSQFQQVEFWLKKSNKFYQRQFRQTKVESTLLIMLLLHLY